MYKSVSESLQTKQRPVTPINYKYINQHIIKLCLEMNTSLLK